MGRVELKALEESLVAFLQFDKLLLSQSVQSLLSQLLKVVSLVALMMIGGSDQGTLRGYVSLCHHDVFAAFEKLLIVQDFFRLVVIFDINCVAQLLPKGNLGVSRCTSY